MKKLFVTLAISCAASNFILAQASEGVDQIIQEDEQIMYTDSEIEERYGPILESGTLLEVSLDNSIEIPEGRFESDQDIIEALDLDVSKVIEIEREVLNFGGFFRVQVSDSYEIIAIISFHEEDDFHREHVSELFIAPAKEINYGNDVIFRDNWENIYFGISGSGNFGVR